MFVPMTDETRREILGVAQEEGVSPEVAALALLEAAITIRVGIREERTLGGIITISATTFDDMFRRIRLRLAHITG